MKKTITLCIGIFILLFQASSFAQLVGGNVYPINGTENAPSSFQSLKTAVTYLSANGVSGTGQVVLEFQSPYDPAADTAAATSITIPNITGTSSSLGITFRPGTGFSTKISISIAGAGSIILNGAKYITFDGRQGGSGATGLTLQNGTSSATAVTSTIQLINDAQFNTLRNLSMTNANTNSSSAAGTLYFGTTTGSTGNSNNTVTNNIFGPVGGSLISCSYHVISNGTAGFPNASNTFTNNEFTNFGFRAIVTTTGTGNFWTVTGNSFYGSLTGTGTHRGINFLTGSGSGHTISNNYFGGRAAQCGGAAYTCAAYIGIDVFFDTLNVSNIQGNTIANFSNTIAATGTAFIGINIAGGKINVGTTAGNVIGSQSDTGNIKLTTTITTAATIFSLGITVSSTAIGTLDIQNNTIGSISINPIGVSSSTFIFRGIDNESALLTGLTNISNNKIGGVVSNSIKSTGTGRPVAIQGITTFGSATINADSVRNFTGATNSGGLLGFGFFDGTTGLTFNMTNNICQNFSALTNTTGIAGLQVAISAANIVSTLGVNNNRFTNFTSTGNNSVLGMTLSNGSFSGTGLNGSISNNTMSNYSNSSTGTAAIVAGISAGTTVTTTLDISSNTISNLSAATTSTTNTSTSAVFGIGWASAAGGTVNFSQNNINTLTCTGTAATHVIGIGMFGGGNILRNRIYGLTNTGATSAGTIKGVVIRAAGTNNIINNQVSLTGISNDVGIYGIENNSAATQINAYYNSFYIGGTTASGANNSAGFFRNGALATIVNLKNNIFCNIRTGGTGAHCNLINSNTTPATGWDSTSGKNNNNLFIVPMGASTVALWNGTALNFDTYKSTAACDFLSLSAVNTNLTTSGTDINVNNLFNSAGTGVLDILNANLEAWYVKGFATQIATVSNDYNGNARSTTVSGGAPCIGSHEFTPSGTPPSALASGAPALNSTTSYTFGGKTLCSIAWGGTGTVPSSIDFKARGGTTPPNALSYNVANFYHTITATGGTGYTYDITINYDESQLGNISSEANIVLAKSDNGGTSYVPFVIADDGSHQAGFYELNTTANTLKVYKLSSFSIFTFTDLPSPLPVELASFTSTVDARNVTLNWSTASEQNNAGFDIERKSAGSAWAKIGNVQGSVNSTSTKNYSYRDNNLLSGKYNYRLKQIDVNGNYKYFDLTNEVIIGVPSKFDLSQNYPNPFNPTTKINYELPFDSKVTINLFDMTGREVANMVSAEQSAGYYTLQFNGANLSSGTYFYRIDAQGGNQNFTKTLKLTLVK